MNPPPMKFNLPFVILLVALLDGACATTPATPQPGPGEPIQAHANFDGSVVRYLDAGYGREALVLIHGWASDVTAWHHQFPDLAPGRRLIAIDLPGHGKSDPPTREYSMALFADAVAAVLDHAQVKRAVLVGHSNGTPVALNFYRRYPARTLGLVAIDGALKSMFDPAMAEQMFAPLRDDDYRTALGGMVDSMAGTMSATDHAMIRKMALKTTHEAVIGGFSAATDPNAYGSDPIGVPLLLVLARSPFWDDEYEAHIRWLAPQVDYRVWDGVGHYIQVERPDALRTAIFEFLLANGLLGRT